MESSQTIKWVPESLERPGYYAAKAPAPLGKLGEKGVEPGTHDIHKARQFDTKEECEAWIVENPLPIWVAAEHGFH